VITSSDQIQYQTYVLDRYLKFVSSIILYNCKRSRKNKLCLIQVSDIWQLCFALTYIVWGHCITSFRYHVPLSFSLQAIPWFWGYISIIYLLYFCYQLYWQSKYLAKTTNFPQVWQTLSHTVLSIILCKEWNRNSQAFRSIHTDCMWKPS
jgi:hypothetical protein